MRTRRRVPPPRGRRPLGGDPGRERRGAGCAASFPPTAPSATCRPSTCRRTPAAGWPTASAFPSSGARLPPRRSRGARAACRLYAGATFLGIGELSAERAPARCASSMQIVRGLDQYRPDAPPSVVAQGTFDGIHLGHQAVIRTAVDRARRLGMRPVAVTFDPNPLAVLRPAEAPPELLPLDERLERIAELGPEVCLVIPFTAEFARGRGRGLRAGRPAGAARRAGDRRRLQPRVRTGSARDPRAPPAPGRAGRGPSSTSCRLSASTVSPSRRRRSAKPSATGDVRRAASLLGRPYALVGRRGPRRGPRARPRVSDGQPGRARRASCSRTGCTRHEPRGTGSPRRRWSTSACGRPWTARRASWRRTSSTWPRISTAGA